VRSSRAKGAAKAPKSPVFACRRRACGRQKCARFLITVIIEFKHSPSLFNAVFTLNAGQETRG
jgi:hypothetical protein